MTARSTGAACGGRLAYECLAGMRVFRMVDDEPVYNWRCLRCGAMGEGNGVKQSCPRPNPSLSFKEVSCAVGKVQRVTRGSVHVGWLRRDPRRRRYWQWAPPLTVRWADHFIGKFVTRAEAARELEARR